MPGWGGQSISVNALRQGGVCLKVLFFFILMNASQDHFLLLRNIGGVSTGLASYDLFSPDLSSLTRD